METGSQVCIVLRWEICHKIVIQIENYYRTKEKSLAQHQTSVVSQLPFVERILKYEVSLQTVHGVGHDWATFTFTEEISGYILFANLYFLKFYNKYILISFFIPSDITILTQSLNTFVCQQKTSPYIYNKLTQLTSFAQVH